MTAWKEEKMKATTFTQSILFVFVIAALLFSCSQQDQDEVWQAERRGIQLTDDVLEAACQFPPHRPFFNRILLDDAGRIYIRNARSVLDQNGAVHLDIFNKDGLYFYTTSLAFAPDLIYKGQMYDIYTSQETGKVEIKRYRIRNWNQMED